jgi:glyoxylase-like metal-dependent hydrolase (beta-lactamase superfamily II)
MHAREIRHDIAHDAGFVEVADRCWLARFEFLDVNVGVVGGDRGLLVVDTHASEVEARRVVELVRRLGAGDVVAVVNTHEHFDHCFGNVVFAEEYDGVAIHAHEQAAAGLRQNGPTLQDQAAGFADDPQTEEDRDEATRRRHREIAATRVVVPEQTFSSAKAIDLGNRLVELVHPGRGHTDGDSVVLVPDADLMFAGDLVEESAVRGGVPGFGDDCYPLDWPFTLDLMISMLTDASVVVPGHGLPVDKDFVLEQRGSIGIVAETIRDLAGKGVPAQEALATGTWPYPAEELARAVARGYEQLPRGARTLPLL